MCRLQNGFAVHDVIGSKEGFEHRMISHDMTSSGGAVESVHALGTVRARLLNQDLIMTSGVL